MPTCISSLFLSFLYVKSNPGCIDSSFYQYFKYKALLINVFTIINAELLILLHRKNVERTIVLYHDKLYHDKLYHDY